MPPSPELTSDNRPEGIREVVDVEEIETVLQWMSARFLASPDFRGVDEARYTPERIRSALTGAWLLAVGPPSATTAAFAIFPPRPDHALELFRQYPVLAFLVTQPGHQAAPQAIALAEVWVRHHGHRGLALSVTQRSPYLATLYDQAGYRPVGVTHWPGARDPSDLRLKEFIEVA